jgi:hypothetical protein
MPLTLDRASVDNLRSFVEVRIRRYGCDATCRFAQEWAQHAPVDWGELSTILEAYRAACDCKVLLRLPDAPDYPPPTETGPPEDGNPWLIEPGFQYTGPATFTKVIVGIAPDRYARAEEGELLVPAPRGARPRRRVRKPNQRLKLWTNFFIGCRSGLPSDIGVVQECPAVAALDFARQVARSGFEELARFSFHEAAYVLSRIAFYEPSTRVGAEFADRVGIASRYEALSLPRIATAHKTDR